MTAGLSDDLQQIDAARKTAIIDAELHRLDIDIAALQETRLADNGSLTEMHYTFFWQGKKLDDRRELGVGFAVRNSLLSMIEPPTGGSERILTLRLSTSSGPVNIVTAYAPTLYSNPDVKDQFYNALDHTIGMLTPSEHIYLLGDFNARVGAEHNTWPTCIGHHGVGKINENGERLLELCCNRNLCVTNTYFQVKQKHRVSWMHPRSRQWHQLDLVITKRELLNSVRITRSYHSADCDTDHSLVLSKIILSPKRLHHAKPKGLPKINTAHTNDAERIKYFTSSFESNFHNNLSTDATTKWNNLRNATYKAAMEAYGRRVRTNADWYEANLNVMEPLTAAKRSALIQYKKDPNRKNLVSLQEARRKSQQLARRCANEYWMKLSSSIEEASNTGNARGMYEGIKQATGPNMKKIAPLKSKTGEIITDRKKQMERWVEHYLELYSTENTVSEEALNSIQLMPIMVELDSEPTASEIEKAINGLANGKAPGNDAIPPEVIKQGIPVLLPHLHELLSLCWREGEVPQDMRDAKIVTLFKNKGDRSDCNNYRGISLLSVVGKVFARVVLARLQILADRIYPESQCGFRSGRSTVDMIFSVRQLQEKCREQQQPLYLAFIDLTKAFDLVSRTGLFKLLEKIGCPPKLLSIIASFHVNMHGFVSFDGEISEPFKIESGVKQGCILAPTLFGIFFSLMLTYAFGTASDGIYLHTRHDGKLFNLKRLRAKTKVTCVLIREMLFADDAALVSHTQEGLQCLMDRFSKACKEFSLTISIKKTEVMAQDAEIPPSIYVDGSNLSVVDNFKYLGSTISSNLSLDVEINARIGKAATVMAKLNKRVWQNIHLTMNTRLKVYQACVTSILLYGSETWTPYARQEAKLNTFHLRCLRRILGITWQDRIPNTTVLEKAKCSSIHALLSQRRLRWLGHICRMGKGRIPKDLLYGELEKGTRKTGCPLLRFKDICKRDMKSAAIDIESWELMVEDRSTWRHLVKEGIRHAENTRNMRQVEKRNIRKAMGTKALPSTIFKCERCDKDCHSKIGLFSHQRCCSINPGANP